MTTGVHICSGRVGVRSGVTVQVNLHWFGEDWVLEVGGLQGSIFVVGDQVLEAGLLQGSILVLGRVKRGPHCCWGE